MGMSRRVLHLHIGRLVVEGLTPQSEKRFVRALEAKLAELASEGMQSAFGGGRVRRIGSLSAGVLRAGTTPEQAAAQATAALRSQFAGKGPGRHA
jgi:hypothetical protein